MVVIIDYGMGNVRSLKNAFAFLGHDVVISRELSDIEAADRLVLPGVGAFRDAAIAIRSLGLEEPLRYYALKDRKPIFGICLGMQLLANTSYEYGTHEGLGLIEAEVIPLQSSDVDKVPHVGWNSTDTTGAEWLFKGLSDNPDFYFVHSFHMVCADQTDVVATTNHNGLTTAAVANKNIVATQFHPEKSQDNGLQILQNWLDREF
jgi:imidazole glycerol-phosphate synthase subunit HisH